MFQFHGVCDYHVLSQCLKQYVLMLFMFQNVRNQILTATGLLILVSEFFYSKFCFQVKMHLRDQSNAIQVLAPQISSEKFNNTRRVTVPGVHVFVYL